MAGCILIKDNFVYMLYFRTKVNMNANPWIFRGFNNALATSDLCFTVNKFYVFRLIEKPFLSAEKPLPHSDACYSVA